MFNLSPFHCIPVGAWTAVTAVCDRLSRELDSSFSPSSSFSSSSSTNNNNNTNATTLPSPRSVTRHKQEAQVAAYSFVAYVKRCLFSEARLALGRLHSVLPPPSGLALPFALRLLAAELPFFEGKALAALQELAGLYEQTSTAIASLIRAHDTSNRESKTAATAASSSPSCSVAEEAPYVHEPDWFPFPAVTESSNGFVSATTTTTEKGSMSGAKDSKRVLRQLQQRQCVLLERMASVGHTKCN